MSAARRHAEGFAVRLTSRAGRTVWLARTDLFPEPVPNYREDL